MYNFFFYFNSRWWSSKATCTMKTRTISKNLWTIWSHCRAARYTSSRTGSARERPSRTYTRGVTTRPCRCTRTSQSASTSDRTSSVLRWGITRLDLCRKRQKKPSVSRRWLICCIWRRMRANYGWTTSISDGVTNTIEVMVLKTLCTILAIRITNVTINISDVGQYYNSVSYSCYQSVSINYS